MSDIEEVTCDEYLCGCPEGREGACVEGQVRQSCPCMDDLLESDDY